MRRSMLLLSLLAVLAIVLPAYGDGPPVDGPYVGVDLGVSIPSNANYQSLVNVGGTGNPYGGYMFNRFIGVQGQLHFAFQPPDNNARGFNHAQQWTSVFGATAGPRLALPAEFLPSEFLTPYVTGEGGYFVGLSGRLPHSAPGFSVGGGLEYSLTPQIALGLFGRYTRTYMSPRPTSFPGQEPGDQGPADAQWVTTGVSFRYSFFRPEERPIPPPPPMAQAAPLPPVSRKIVLRSVYFDFDKSNIRPDAVPVLDEAVRILKQDRTLPIVVVGHTDSIGSDAYNLKLSQRRANAVRDYFVAHGISSSRIRTEGRGKSDPVASNDTADGRAQNRRVELHLQ